MTPDVPVPLSERLEAPDVLRGFALLGILLVNALFFSRPGQELFMFPWASQPDPRSLFLVATFALGKFYALYALLFGFGFSLQMARWEEGSRHGTGRFLRRLGVLLGIGLVHGCLIWSGDILTLYALLGLLLPLFRRRSQRGLLIWAGILLVLNSLLWLGVAGLVRLGLDHAPGQMDTVFTQMRQDMARLSSLSLQAYGQGPFGTLAAFRVREFGSMLLYTLFAGPQFLALFLLGIWTHRSGLLQDPVAQAPRLRRMALLGLGLGLPLNLAVAWMCSQGLAGPSMPGYALGQTLGLWAYPLLTVGYASALLLLLPRLGRLLRSLAWPGRMPLSNYLLQSVVMTSIFYFYGGGLFWKLSLPWVLGIAVLLWLVQIPLSAWWLVRFRLGPVEWLWRSLTYGQAQPMRRKV